MWGRPRNFPRAILHIDGDGFFAACEIAKDPALRGKPVITGKERGIVSACTYEAKVRGVKRGMTIPEVRKVCPEAIILPSDYETYSLFSERMYEIVRRFTPAVEEYSIDECFADLTGLRRMHRAPYREIAARIKKSLEVELGMTFSLGLSCTKVLAKVGSKWHKPAGLTTIPLSESALFLSKTPVGGVWGIGASTDAYLQKFGITTAWQFARCREEWVREHLTKPGVELWQELNGSAVLSLDTEGRRGYQSIQKTKTFTPPTTERGFIFSQLSKNIENACIKARRWDLATSEVSFFLKTQEFKFHGASFALPHPTSVPQDILRMVRERFDGVYRRGVLYRATGITLCKLKRDDPAQLDIFGKVARSDGMKQVFKSVDLISERYGKHAVYLGSSFEAMHQLTHLGERGDIPARVTALFRSETARRRLGIPYLGEVK